MSADSTSGQVATRRSAAGRDPRPQQCDNRLGKRHRIDSYDEPGLGNVGFGKEVSVRDFSSLIAGTVGFEGNVAWDAAKPSGTSRKLVDSARIRRLGWEPKVGLIDETLRDAIARDMLVPQVREEPLTEGPVP